MERYSANDLMASMRDALRAVAPMMDRVGIPHRPAEAQYDGWEQLEAQIFRSVIGNPAEMAGAKPMADYGFSFESYAGRSFVGVVHEGTEMLALVRFNSVAESFDSVFCAEVDPKTLAVGAAAIVTFGAARFALCPNVDGVIRSFEYLSY